MISLLVDICLRSVMNGFENGSIKDAHSFGPPQLRQRLLNMVLARGKIETTIWKRELSSAEFLRGFSSLSTRRGKKKDTDYLDSVAQSIGSILENGESIGSRIRKLELNFMLYETDESAAEDKNESNIDAVVRLIARCPNLKSLNIETKFDVDGGFRTGHCFELLNRSESTELCLAILENLEELSLNGIGLATFLIAQRPIIDFKKLESLRLVNCTLGGRSDCRLDVPIDGVGLAQLLIAVRNTLVDLHFSQVNIGRSTNYYLPIPFPMLKSFELNGYFRCTRQLVDNLERCPKLENVELFFVSYYDDRGGIFSEDEENLKALSRLKIDNLEVKIRVCIRDVDDEMIIDRQSKFKMVSIFGDKISHFELDVNFWNPGYTEALKHAVDSCSNLTSFTFLSPGLVDDYVSEKEKVNSVLARLFGDRRRASKLRNLYLQGDFDQEILTLIFENCSQLDSLTMCYNKLLTDSHLNRWADGGARPSKLIVEFCDNISDDGLIPVLISSGGALKQFHTRTEAGLNSSANSKITDRTWRALIDWCPNVERAIRMPEDMWELACSKCFDIEFE